MLIISLALCDCESIVSLSLSFCFLLLSKPFFVRNKLKLLRSFHLRWTSSSFASPASPLELHKQALQLRQYHSKGSGQGFSSMNSYSRFFLVILQEMLKDDKISLPMKTVRKFGEKIPHRVVFKLPDSVEWEMGVIKSEKMVWFGRGWREFTEYYGVDHGSLLMLKFDGESAFKVFIYDKTATEIDYPQKPSKKTGNSMKLERGLRGKSLLPEPRPFKKLKLEDPWPGTAEFRDTHIVSDDEEDGGEPNAEAIIPISKWRKTETIAATKKTQALERTSSFKSDNPFFRVIMQPSYISSSFSLYVPCKFARKYLRLNQGDSTFTVANGGTWHASWKLEYPHDRVRFVVGWKKFVLDNHLKVGDVCVFELIKQLCFKVSIFPADDCRDPSRCQGPKSRKIPRKHVTKNPFFEICIGTSSILQASLHIPGKFANEYLARNDIEKVTFKVGDRRWVVKVKRYSTAIKLSGGWRTFARDNALQVKDECIFELVDGDTYEFQVSILRSPLNMLEFSNL